MKPQFIIVAFALVVAVTAAGISSPLAEAALIASAGFNDASGINSDGVADSPYTIGGLLNSAGAGEPGWAGTWGGGGNIVVVQDSVVFEGDGAAELLPLSGTSRTLAAPQTDFYRIEQQMRFDVGARLVVYSDQQANEGEAFQGPIWRALPDGNFRVIDGVGNACIVCPEENTGFTWSPDVWYEVAIEIDVPSQTWEFFVDGVKYNAPDPLGYRGTPQFLDRVRYQSEGSGGSAAFLDALTVSTTPEPEPDLGPPFGPPFDGEPPFGPPQVDPRFGPPFGGDPPFGPPQGVPPGDGNLNGLVEAGDYTIWANNFGAASPQFTDGDYNGDGVVNAGDFTTWANNFGHMLVAPDGAAHAPAAAGTPTAVPEPSTFMLTCIGLLGLTAYGWRRRRRA